jgi:hypothetical protein
MTNAIIERILREGVLFFSVNLRYDRDVKPGGIEEET